MFCVYPYFHVREFLMSDCIRGNPMQRQSASDDQKLTIPVMEILCLGSLKTQTLLWIAAVSAAGLVKFEMAENCWKTIVSVSGLYLCHTGLLGSWPSFSLNFEKMPVLGVSLPRTIAVRPHPFYPVLFYIMGRIEIPLPLTLNNSFSFEMSSKLNIAPPPSVVASPRDCHMYLNTS